MELEHSEAAQILREHRIDVSDEDPRPITIIAEQFILTGSVALNEIKIDPSIRTSQIDEQ